MPTLPASPDLLPPARSTYGDIRESLIRLYLDDPRPWLVGFSGGKDSTMVASLIFEAVATLARRIAPNRSLFSAPIPASKSPPSSK